MRLGLFFFFGILFTLRISAQDTEQLVLWYEQQDYQKVVSSTAEATSASAMMLRADALHKLGEFAEAEHAYNMAEELGASGKQLYLHRGICRFSLASYEAGRQDLLQAYERDAFEPRVPYYLGAIAYMQDDFKTALAYLEDAMRLDDQYYDAVYLKGAVYIALGKGASAEAAFAECIELRESDRRAILNLALSYADQFRFEEARKLLDDLIRNVDGELLRDCYYHRGLIRFDDHDQLGACEDWSNAADLGDEMAESHMRDVCDKGAKKVRKRKTIHVAF